MDFLEEAVVFVEIDPLEFLEAFVLVFEGEGDFFPYPYAKFFLHQEASLSALHRKSPRALSDRECQHITLAYRLIPVFNEEKILRYFDKISKEMIPGDLWCGSIALPEDKFYETYTIGTRSLPL